MDDVILSERFPKASYYVQAFLGGVFLVFWGFFLLPLLNKGMQAGWNTQLLISVSAIGVFVLLSLYWVLHSLINAKKIPLSIFATKKAIFLNHFLDLSKCLEIDWRDVEDIVKEHMELSGRAASGVYVFKGDVVGIILKQEKKIKRIGWTKTNGLHVKDGNIYIDASFIESDLNQFFSNLKQVRENLLGLE